MSLLDELATPVVLIDRDRLANNIQAMQARCDARGVELRPHIKTHKMVAVARQQLAAGAVGLTCAKLGEAEAMLPSGARRIFVAHSLVDARQAARVAELAERLDELRLAVTSEAQAEALAAVARRAGRKFEVMMAVDTGLGREGVRSVAAGAALAACLAASGPLELRGFYTHEGHLYGAAPAEQAAQVAAVIDRVAAVRDAVDRRLPIWPGCSVSAAQVVDSGRAAAVRPGAYVFGDLFLSAMGGVMAAEAVAASVLATVVDQPEDGLALIDAGSKTFSGDRTPAGVHARASDGRDLAVVRVNEEHGYVRGAAVGELRVGERVRFVPAHICPAINLTDEVVVLAGGEAVARWTVDARGRVR